MKVDRLDALDGGNQRFRATFADGTGIEASRVVIAVGFEHFTHEPDDVRAVPASGPDLSVRAIRFSGIADACSRALRRS